MPIKTIQLNGRPILVHKACVNPDFNEKTVLVEDTWTYVDMWLKRQHANSDAKFYWQQAQDFYSATKQLPKTSSPLTAYYCILNAAKCLLKVKGIAFSDKHGVTGNTTGTKAALVNELVIFKGAGILPALCTYLNEPSLSETFTLRDIFYNLPFIHRAYNLTFENQPELYIPIVNPHFVKQTTNPKSWVCAEIIDKKYQNQNTINKLPAGYERDMGFPDKWIIRRTNRFNWNSGVANKAANFTRLKNYHQATRKQIQYIYGNNKLWYIKRGGVPNIIDRNSLTLTFAAMHKLSELARYRPTSLARHFESQHNWLLSEFIDIALYQYIDGISSEITGKEFMIPGRRNPK
ncbi:MAG: hypothetical protein KGZ81_10350 [Flavobacteriales bacterium]|nr:hypothetical protein [Flavobacteriales bacterium]